jgi:hypothetical protein
LVIKKQLIGLKTSSFIWIFGGVGTRNLVDGEEKEQER